MAGAHRLQAVKSLGWEYVDAFFTDADDIDRQLWEIDENLIRSELTPTQQAEHLAKRKELWGRRSSGANHPTGGGKPGKNKGFAQDTADATGQDKRNINKAISRAEGVTEAARDAIRGTDLDKGVVLDELKKVPLAEQLKRVQMFGNAKPQNPALWYRDLLFVNRFMGKTIDTQLKCWPLSNPAAQSAEASNTHHSLLLYVSANRCLFWASTREAHMRFFLVLLLTTTQALAGVQVRDADTIVVDGTPVRLQGVDAPELDHTSGQDARRWMVNYLRGKDVSCELTGERTYDRYVGVCFADGEDIGAAVIAAGHALDCARYSGGRYAGLETSAAKSRIKRARYC